MKKMLTVLAAALMALGAFSPAMADPCAPEPTNTETQTQQTVDATGTTVTAEVPSHARVEGDNGWIEVYGKTPTATESGYIGVRGQDSGDNVEGDVQADRNGASGCVNDQVI